MPSFVRSITELVLGIVLPLYLQLYLSRKMAAERRARGWSRATWAFALYAVGPFSMIPFSWVTRRWRGSREGVRALAIGVVWATACLAVLSAWHYLYGFAFDLPD